MDRGGQQGVRQRVGDAAAASATAQRCGVVLAAPRCAVPCSPGSLGCTSFVCMLRSFAVLFWLRMLRYAALTVRSLARGQSLLAPAAGPPPAPRPSRWGRGRSSPARPHPTDPASRARARRTTQLTARARMQKPTPLRVGGCNRRTNMREQKGTLHDRCERPQMGISPGELAFTLASVCACRPQPITNLPGDLDTVAARHVALQSCAPEPASQRARPPPRRRGCSWRRSLLWSPCNLITAPRRDLAAGQGATGNSRRRAERRSVAPCGSAASGRGRRACGAAAEQQAAAGNRAHPLRWTARRRSRPQVQHAHGRHESDD